VLYNPYNGSDGSEFRVGAVIASFASMNHFDGFVNIAAFDADTPTMRRNAVAAVFERIVGTGSLTPQPS
jgi:hypothetical protein